METHDNHATINEKTKFSPDMFEKVSEKATEDNEKISAPSLSFLQDSWRRLKKNKAAVISLALLVVIIVLAFSAPLIAPHSPYTQYDGQTSLPPKIPGINIDGLNGTTKAGGDQSFDKYAQLGVDEDTYYILGTDSLGRDLLSRILYGTRVSLIIHIQPNASHFFDVLFRL